VDGEGGEPSVSIGPFLSETDELEREREKQETRRLLYVAMTRARDRLYLSSALKDGVLVPGRGSLAEVLPDSLKQLFSHAATAFQECEAVGWTGQSGRPFEWRICRAPATGDVSMLTAREEGVAESPDDAFGPIEDASAIRRVAVTEWLKDATQGDLPTAGNHGGTTAGLLVHRLFQSAESLEGRDEDAQFAYARGLLHPEELIAVEDIDIDATVTTALTAWRAMRARADVTALLASGRRLHEVPFSMRMVKEGTPVVLRGAIDCLIQKDDGSVVVVEFKTGRRQSAHQQQLDVYIEAARALFPGASVEGRLVYPN